SDWTLFLLKVSLPGGGAFIVETGGEPLQYLSPPFVIQLNLPEPKYLPVNRLMAVRARARFARMKANLKVPSEWLDSSAETLMAPPYAVQKIPVIHPEAEMLRARDPRFLIVRHSVFQSLTGPVDVIRSMNIFNRGYFSSERLAEGVHAVWRSLKAGGMWIAGRTWREGPPAHHVSLFEKDAAGFRLVERTGEGSEIETLALEFRSAAGAIES